MHLESSISACNIISCCTAIIISNMAATHKLPASSPPAGLSKAGGIAHLLVIQARRRAMRTLNILSFVSPSLM